VKNIARCQTIVCEKEKINTLIELFCEDCTVDLNFLIVDILLECCNANDAAVTRCLLHADAIPAFSTLFKPGLLSVNKNATIKLFLKMLEDLSGREKILSLNVIPAFFNLTVC
jgi:hypothetical protein